MGKIKETRQLYKTTLKEISSSPSNWRTFLDSSAWNFKYDFDDQVLIFAQRPDARACATMDEWNRKLKRWVNNRAEAIYVYDKNPNSEYPFKLVFDLSDTHNYNNTEYKLWNIKQEYEKDIIEDLEANFGDMDLKEDLSKAIISASYNMVVDDIEDYLTDIIKNKSNTMLNDISDDEIKDILIGITWASVSYMLMIRCGINARENISENEFEFLKYFNSPELFTILGASVSDIAESGLREIAKTVSTLQKKENLKNRTFAKMKMRYILMIIIKMKEGLKMLEKIEYTKQGDYLIPNLTMKKEKIPAGKYSMMRYNYLLNHKNHELTILVMNNELNSHLQEIQDQASKRVEMLVEEMAKKENITEELKAQDQMKWVGLMNNIKMTAEEIVATELIYQ